MSFEPYIPFSLETDERVRRQLESEILWQWVEEDSNDLPPEVIGAEDGTPVDALWNPASVAQRMALECTADILLYGGSAGSLKSETLMVDCSLEVDNPNYNGILFRQSFPELRDLVKKSLRLYPKLGGKFVKGSPMCWTFPSGAKIWMGYLGHDDDVFQHQGQEYSFIGFDEAGHQTEARIRYMLTRLRSTDPTLKQRMRLTANPGGPGHSMLMHVFLKGVCPHCDPSSAVEPGRLYYDATWKSDGQPLSVRLPNGKEVQKSVAFIPGKITDHNLLGEDYIANLMMQSAATAKQLMDGCWKVWEGQFFDCFQESRGVTYDRGRVTISQPDMRMVVGPEDIEVKHWYPHTIGGDYGFSGSAAAALLLVRTPTTEHFKNGRFYVLDEYCERGVTAKDYAKGLLERWFLDSDGYVPERPRALQLWAVSPDAYRKDGVVNDQDVSFSRIEQMNEIIGQYGFSFCRANDDRKSGWMRLYQMLRDGELVILRHCKLTIEMFQTRLRDPKKFDDVWKIAGDPLDDVADALRYGIMTWPLDGVKPIQEKIEEAIKGLSPTNAMITIRKLQSEERRSGGSVLVSPKARRGRLV